MKQSKKLYPEDSDTENGWWMLSCSYSKYRHGKHNELHWHGSLSERWSFNHQENQMCDKIIKLANLKIKGRIEQQTRVYSTKGISPTLNSAIGHGGNWIPLFLIVKYKNDNISKEIIHTAPNGKKYSIQIRKYTPRDCFRLMGVHETDIDKLLSKEKSGQLIICKSKLYALAGNSIVTNRLTAMFEELIFPSGNHYHDKNGQLSLF